MPDDSLDTFVAQAVEPMPSPLSQKEMSVSPMQMWLWWPVGPSETSMDTWGWVPVDVSDSIDKAMRAYMLFWEKTGWRLARMEHIEPEKWMVMLVAKESKMHLEFGQGSTAAIAICEAIKAASLADAEAPKRDAVPSAIL